MQNKGKEENRSLEKSNSLAENDIVLYKADRTLM